LRPRYPHSFPTRRSSDLLVGIVEAAVGEDVALGAFEETDALELGAEGVDLGVLLGDALGGQAVGELQHLRVIGDAVVFVAELLGDRKSTRLNSSHVSISY